MYARERAPPSVRKLHMRGAGVSAASVLQRRAIDQRPDSVAARHSHRAVDHNGAPLVRVEADGLEPRAGRRPGCPCKRRVRISPSLSSNPVYPPWASRARVLRRISNAARLHPLKRITTQRLAQLRQDAVARNTPARSSPRPQAPLDNLQVFRGKNRSARRQARPLRTRRRRSRT